MPIPFPFPLPIPLPLIRAEVWSFDQAGHLIDGAYDQALIGSSKGASIGALKGPVARISQPTCLSALMGL
jgi:hypothetical protein